MLANNFYAPMAGTSTRRSAPWGRQQPSDVRARLLYLQCRRVRQGRRRDGVLEDPRHAFDLAVFVVQGWSGRHLPRTGPDRDGQARTGPGDPARCALYPGWCSASHSGPTATPRTVPHSDRTTSGSSSPIPTGTEVVRVRRSSDYQAHQKAEAKFAPIPTRPDPPQRVPSARRQAAASRLER